MTFLLWMEKPLRANEQKQDCLAPTWGGDSTVMTNTWSRAVAMLALAQQIPKSRSGRLRCLCLWSRDLRSERALGISTHAHLTAGGRQRITHHAAIDPDASPFPAIRAGTAVPGEASLSPAMAQGQLPRCERRGFSLILSWQPGENRTQRVTHFIPKLVAQGRRSRWAREGVHSIAWCPGGWWHLPWHTSGSSTLQAWLLEEK